jgi:hypothetical protein
MRINNIAAPLVACSVGCAIAGGQNADLLEQKYWSPVGSVDNVYGDRSLFCSCVPVGDNAD